MDHHSWGPSSLPRRLACSASPRMEEGLADTQTAASIEGTFAHTVAEAVLKRALRAKDLKFEGAVTQELLNVTDEMMGYVMKYVNKILDYYTDALKLYGADNVQILIETKLDYSNIIEGAFGTSDTIIITPTEVQVHDLKYGMYPVSADSIQLKTYGFAAEQSLDERRDDIILIIHQPRLGVVEEHRTTRVEVAREMRRIRRAYYTSNAFDVQAPPTPGRDQCVFCKAAVHNVCKPYLKWLTKGMAASFELVTQEDGKLNEVDKLSIEELEQLGGRVSLLKTWIDNLKNALVEKAYQGELKTLKMIHLRRGKEVFTDEKVALAKLTLSGVDDAVLYVEKVRTLTQIKKDLNTQEKDVIKNLTIRQQSVYSLVSIDDKRPAVLKADKVKSEFKNCETETKK